MSRVLIQNIGKIVSGELISPFCSGDAILVEKGRIAKIGTGADLAAEKVDEKVDAQGTILIPGLIDSHAHPVLGDYTPRQKMVDFIDSYVHGGVTTMISAGESHVPGKASDVAMVKALAILSAKSFVNYRPSGMKVQGGALILEPGLTEADFEEVARAGVRSVGEIGLGKVKTPEEARPMVDWAKKYGMTVMIHCGGSSVPGSATLGLDQIVQIGPDVVSHINGGPTAIPLAEVEQIIKKTSFALEIVQCGNPRIAVEAIKIAMEVGALERVIIGNDAPSGTGVIPLGVLRTLGLLCSFTDLKPEVAIALATGNTARVHKLKEGLIEEGRPADLVIMDAPLGSTGRDALEAIKVGDIPGITMVMIDGEIRVRKSRNTPQPHRECVYH
jgi:enamidase